MFYKELSGLSVEEVKEIFLHSTYVYEQLKCEYINPKPIEYNDVGIFYEYVELPRDLTSSLKLRTDDISKAFHTSGAALAKIHKCSNLLHGDYVCHNICYFEGELYIFDPHPPESIGYEESFIYGNADLELSFFLVNIPLSFGLKSSIKNNVYVINLIASVVRGYRTLRTVKRISIIKSLPFIVLRQSKIMKCSAVSLCSLKTVISSIYVLFALIFRL